MLAGALAFCVSVGGAYVKGRADGADIEQASVLREERIATAARDEALRVTADAIQRIEIKHVTIRQTLEKEIYEKPVYRECRHSPGGLRDINAALSAGTVGAGDRKLPGIDAAK